MAPASPAPGTRERIDIRLRHDQKSAIERAAAIRGLTLTDFIVQNSVADAHRTIREHETWTLDRADAESFFNALLNPPQPNNQLVKAAQRYRQHFLRG